MFLSKLGVVSSVISFSKHNNRILSVLISLEALMLSLLLLFFSSSTMHGGSDHLFLVLVVFAACEAGLGLSMLVNILRLRGNDYVTSFSSTNF